MSTIWYFYFDDIANFLIYERFYSNWIQSVFRVFDWIFFGGSGSKTGLLFSLVRLGKFLWISEEILENSWIFLENFGEFFLNSWMSLGNPMNFWEIPGKFWEILKDSKKLLNILDPPLLISKRNQYKNRHPIHSISLSHKKNSWISYFSNLCDNKYQFCIEFSFFPKK